MATRIQLEAPQDENLAPGEHYWCLDVYFFPLIPPLHFIFLSHFTLQIFLPKSVSFVLQKSLASQTEVFLLALALPIKVKVQASSQELLEVVFEVKEQIVLPKKAAVLQEIA